MKDGRVPAVQSYQKGVDYSGKRDMAHDMDPQINAPRFDDNLLEPEKACSCHSPTHSSEINAASVRMELVDVMNRSVPPSDT